MSCWDVVMLNQRCGYVKKDVVMLLVTKTPWNVDVVSEHIDHRAY